MTRDQLDAIEDLLVDIATTGAHLETAIIFIQRGHQEHAIVELRAALSCNHKVKLRTMATRWMEHPETFKKLIKDQIKWLERKYRVFNS